MPAAEISLTFSSSPYPVSFFEQVVTDEATRLGVEIELAPSEPTIEKRDINPDLAVKVLTMAVLGKDLAEPLVRAIRERLKKRNVEVDAHYGHEDGYR